MNLSEDTNALELVRAVRPFLSDKGKTATDDLLGVINIMSIVDVVSKNARNKVRTRSADGKKRSPLAFLANFSRLNIEPEMIASVIDMFFTPQDEPQYDNNEKFRRDVAVREQNTRNINTEPNNEDEMVKVLKSFMNKATTDPNFAAMLSDVQKNGLDPNTLSSIVGALSNNSGKQECE